MRFAVFVFSLVLVIMPTYVHAIAFVPAVTGALVRSGAGQFVKVQSKKALASFATTKFAKNTLITVATGYCLKNKQKCKDWVGDVAETFFDDDNTDDGCVFKMFYSSRNNYSHHQYHDKLSDAINASYGFKSGVSSRPTDEIERKNKEFVSAKENLKKRAEQFRNSILDYSVPMQHFRYDNGFQSSIQVGMHYRLACGDEAQEELKKIIERIKDDDPDYIINNYGDTINIEQYCSAHACDELTAEFGDEVMKNKSKYDIDKINKANCEVENNKIKSCKNAKKDKDEQETEQTEQTDEQQTEGQGDKGDQDPIECDASAFHKKVCDFIDWYQDDTDLDNDTKVKVTDLSDDLQLDKNRIKFTTQCPADKTFKMAYAGVEVSPTISYKSLCDGFIMLKPFIIGLSGIAAVLIIAGGRRG